MADSDPSPGDGRRWLPVVVACGIAALVAVAVAPHDWEPGPGRLEVSVGTTRGSLPVTVGDDRPVGPTAVDPTASVVVELPAGLPLGAPVEVVVTGPPGSITSPADVDVALVTESGRERLPVLDVDDDRAHAQRRPPRHSRLVFALLAVVIVLWVTEAVPLFVTALAIPVVLAVGDVAPAAEVLAPFFDPIIVLFLAGFLMARAMHDVGLDTWAASRLVAAAGSGPRRLFATFVVVAAGASMWMSNTAAVAVLLPIALTVTRPLDDPGYQRATVLGIAYAATIGGVGSAIGTPANQLAIRFAEEVAGRRITFVEWFAVGLPLVVVFLPLMALYLWWSFDISLDTSRVRAARAEARRHRDEAGRLERPQLQVLAVFGGVLAGWLTQAWHGVSPGIVALGGAVALFVLGRLDAGDLDGVSWPTLMTFGGGLALGLAMVRSGTADWLVTRLVGTAVLPELVAVAVLAAGTLALTTVVSNTASAATLVPLAAPLAGVVGLDPVALMLVVALASSIDFALVIGTPPTMLAYGTELFTTRDILRRGLPLDLLGLVLLVGPVLWWWEFTGVTRIG